MSLTLILGCMFSGKTTELMRYVKRDESIGRRVIIMNHSFDKKRSPQLTNHSGESMGCISLHKLNDVFGGEIDMSDSIQEYDTIAINEGQFFEDLEDFVLYCVETLKKSVIVCGLDSDFKRVPFMNIINLVPHADELLKLKALCVECKDGTPAFYSKRTIQSDDRVLVGASDSYKPVCRSCYLK